MAEKKAFRIINHAKLLYECFMLNRKIKTDVHPANIFDWEGPLKIVIGDMHLNASLKVVPGFQTETRRCVALILLSIVSFIGVHRTVLLEYSVPYDPKEECRDHITSR